MNYIPLNSFKFHRFFIPSAFVASFFLLSIGFLSCAPTLRTGRSISQRTSTPELIRLFVEEFSAPRSIKFSNEIYLDIGTESVRVPGGAAINLRVIEGEINLRYRRYNYKGLSFEAESLKKSLIYNGREYKGTIRFVVNNSKILAINYLDTEEYLKGVIQGEIGIAANKRDFEALKAFTICARNFAYMKINENKMNFDVYGDVRDQVYSVITTDNAFINKAAEETKGLVLLYDNDLAQIFYYSSCGGWTEDYVNVFGRNKVEYLPSVKDGNEAYCSISPSFNWNEKYTFDDIIDFLRNAKVLDNQKYVLKSIAIKDRFASGRINELLINLSSENGDKQVVLNGNKIRNVIRSHNGGLLRSTLCDVHISGQNVIIEGKGYGHGVGLCQWGAIGQARKGKSFKEILYFYFPGTNIGQTELASDNDHRG